ncbi:MAG: nucleotide exchange factor GrpE, partial [Spartobacteria bacterium]
VPEGHVVRQVRKGYKIKDRLVRASSVIVSKGPQ